MKSDCYISVVIEADGPIPGVYSMLSLGACVVGEPGRAFYVELQPIADAFVPDALAVSGLDRMRLASEGATPEAALRSFCAWVAAVTGPEQRPVFVSFSSWDWTFVYYYLMRFVGSSPFGHSSLDIKSCYMGRLGGGWTATVKRRIAKEHPELLAGAGPHTHHALDDAQEQAELFRRLLALGSAATDA